MKRLTLPSNMRNQKFTELTDKDYVLIAKTKKYDTYQQVDEGDIIKIKFED